jgi:uncharacterized membrane protein
MSNDEHLYRTVGMLLSGVPSMAVTVLLVLSLSVGIVLAAAIGIAVGLIGSGAGAAVYVGNPPAAAHIARLLGAGQAVVLTDHNVRDHRDAIRAENRAKGARP